MEVQQPSKMTLVTVPDYHLDPGSDRILIMGSFRTTQNFQDSIGAYWPKPNVTVYSASGKEPENLDWLFYNSKIVDTIFVAPTDTWEYTWPIISTSSAKLFFVIANGPNHGYLRDSLKLTYPGRLFNTEEEAVLAAASAST